MNKDTRVSDERLALEVIERIIRENIVANDGPDRMKIGDDWHTGPAVDATMSILRGLQQIAANGLRSKPVGVEVKGLEWEGQTAIDALGLRWTVYMDYGREDGKECFACNCIDGTWPTIEAAKAAAEADYRQRILSALSLPEQEPVAWQRKLRKRGTPGWGEWKECTKSQAEYAEAYGHPQDFEEVEAVVRPLYASPQPKAVITEEMVERAARAMDPFAFRDNSVATDEWHELEVEGRAQALGRARAALEAALKGA